MRVRVCGHTRKLCSQGVPVQFHYAPPLGLRAAKILLSASEFGSTLEDL